MEKLHDRDRKKPMNNILYKCSVPLTALLLSANVVFSSNTKTTNDIKSLFSETEPTEETQNNISEINTLDKEKIAIEYLKNNLFIGGQSIVADKFNHAIETTWKDKYQISYNHPFEGLNNFSDPKIDIVKLDISFSYKNNNIFIQVNNINIWKEEKEKENTIVTNKTIEIDKVIYDYQINKEENKSINLNIKTNPYKTHEKINQIIKGIEFKLKNKIPEVKQLENTQMTLLNNITLGQEIFTEQDKYYREIYITENNKYRPISKVYFDKYGNIITNDQNINTHTTVLWIDIHFELEKTDSLITLKLNNESIKQLALKIQEQRETVMNIINKAKVWPNTEFSWFNKIQGERDWSGGKDIRWFNTKLIWLTLIDDTYVFQRGQNKENSIYFGTKHNENNKDEVFLKNLNNEKVNNFYIKINNNFYKVSLKDKELSIIKIKKEQKNIENNLPKYTGEKNITEILNNNTLNTKNISENSQKPLSYRTPNGNNTTSISVDKNKWTYKLETNTTPIDLMDLYSCSDFKSTISEIQNLQTKSNTLDIDILNSFKRLLTNNWIDLTERKAIKVTNTKWESFYCTIGDKKNNFQIEKDQKLYKIVKESLNIIKKRLEVVKMLNETKIKWKNNGKEVDFKAFIWWWWGIWTRHISQTNISNFISQNTNKLELTIVRWEWETTTIIYDLSPKSWEFKLKWKKTISISWQTYKISINDELNIILNPIEK